MLGTILAAGFGLGALMGNPPRRRKKRRRNPEDLSPIRRAGRIKNIAVLRKHAAWHRDYAKKWLKEGRKDLAARHEKEADYNDAEAIRLEATLRTNPRRRRNPSTEVTELVLYITNDSVLYRQQAQPIIANLRKKIAKGTYDAAKAVKLWGYLANSGAQKYTKEYGGSGNGSYGSFSAADRREAAKELAESYEEELRSTNPRRKTRRGGKLYTITGGHRGRGVDHFRVTGSWKHVQRAARKFVKNRGMETRIFAHDRAPLASVGRKRRRR